MDIKLKEVTNTFGHVDIGETFEYLGDVYMHTSRTYPSNTGGASVKNAVRLTGTTAGEYTLFQPGDLIRPVKLKAEEV
jgi:hypothetical protein